MTSNDNNPLSKTFEFSYCAGCYLYKPRNSLSLCSKCQCTQFCSKECQRSIWRYHKIHCSLPDDNIKTYDKDTCMKCIEDDMKKDKPGSKNIAYVLRRLYELLRDDSTIGDDAGQIGYTLHSLTRMPMCVQSPRTDYYMSLWAAPGMATFLLGQCIENVPRMGGVHAYVKYQLYQELSEEEKASKSFESDDDYYGSNTCEFTYFLFYILLRTACVQSLDMSELATKTISIRQNPPAKAAAKRAIKMWSSLEYSGDSMAGGAEFVSFFLENHYEEFFKDVAVADLILGCVEDMSCGYNKFSYDMLNTLFSKQLMTIDGSINELSVRRIYHAANYIKEKQCDDDDNDPFAYEKNGPSKAQKENLVERIHAICELNAMVNRNRKEEATKVEGDS